MYQEKIKVGFVGGSNTLLRNGYIDAFKRIFIEKYRIEVVVETIAIGATSTLTGLANLCRSNIHSRVDVLVFEYALNDSASFGRRPDLYEHWAQAYEGVIIKSKQKKPELIFLSLILGQKRSDHSSKICSIGAGIRYLSDRHEGIVVDINHYLASEYPELYNSDELYADMSHYSRPAGVEIIAKKLAEEVFFCLKKRKNIFNGLPLYKKNFSHAKYIGFNELNNINIEHIFECKNSLFTEKFLKISKKLELRFKLNGRILLWNFISHPSSPPIEIIVNDSCFYMETARRTFEKKPLKFLLSSYSPEFHGDFSLTAFNSEVIIRVSENYRKNNIVFEDHSNSPSGFFGLPACNSEEESFWVNGVMYLGDIRNIRIEPRNR